MSNLQKHLDNDKVILMYKNQLGTYTLTVLDKETNNLLLKEVEEINPNEDCLFVEDKTPEKVIEQLG